MTKKSVVIGIDEVGRGALCGTVTVAAFAFLRREDFLSEIRGTTLKDSKRLTPKGRTEWFVRLARHAREGNVAFATARVSPRTVDRINIRNAANLAATRAYERLVAREGFSPRALVVLLDGGLFIAPTAAMAPRRTRTIVRGDERIPEIQLASVVAKVTRDRAMVRLHARHPAYGFAAHKGYGTRAHAIALARFGPIAGLHRLTFIGKFSKVHTV